MSSSFYRRVLSSKWFQAGANYSSKGIVYSLKAYLAYNCIFTISETSGPSMLPTLYPDGDSVIHMSLPVYRFFAPMLPKEVAPAFHPIAHSDDNQITGASKENAISSRKYQLSQKRYIGGPRDKLDPAMGTGISVGDLVVVCSMRDASVEVCKRVIGLAGDTILVDPREKANVNHSQQWTVHQNARNQDTKDRQLPDVTEPGPKYVVVPPGHIWIVGDNLPNSTDSRDYGPVPLGMVRGRIVAKILPWKERKWLPNGMEKISQSV